MRLLFELTQIDVFSSEVDDAVLSAIFEHISERWYAVIGQQPGVTVGASRVQQICQELNRDSQQQLHNNLMK